MDEWIEFSGKAIDNGEAWLLEAARGDGAFAALKSDVRVIGDEIQVRQGAIVQIVKKPQSGGKPASIEVPAGDCPCGLTKCIGFVVICCRDSRVIGTALGVWDDCP
ncbi:MAG: hypothetical protein WD069_12770 [Planctomycetales bacterium]